ncbi:MAG: multidrug efflux RND transporter permease subunit [Gammaproteobacteria bacterium]|nr:hydrophobe/amphiphile efflux-1 family RND transporter [Gammaproteobacteria bacterium]
MRLTHFFVERPIFATVIAIVITLVGAFSYPLLPVAQFPQIAPPTINVSVTYPGASAEVVSETVLAPLEQQINGVENMLYMTSTAVANGQSQILVAFKQGTDLDTAQVQVQNRVAVAEPRLPEQVRALGVVVSKQAPGFLMLVTMKSSDPSVGIDYLGNWANTVVRDRLLRIEGVGDVRVFGGGDYAMRIWIDPDRAAARNLTASEIVQALRTQNVQVAAGSIGQAPMERHAAAFLLPIQMKGRLEDPAEFEDVIIKVDADGAVTRLRDVGRAELTRQDFSVSAYSSGGLPTIGMAIIAQPETNELAAANAVLEELEAMLPEFPPGVSYSVPYNPTEFVEASIAAVQQTLFEAVLLVVVVIVVFLQTWRAAIIPIVVIPVALIGAMAVLLALGYSLNSLALFALVLAVGIVVDDAIVVVENVERNIRAGLSPREAAHRTMDEVSGALIAIGLVLLSVFVPTAFVSGIPGLFYRQFAVTISATAVISLLLSLTLTPAMAALLLRPHDAHAADSGSKWLAPLRLAGSTFNRYFDKLGDRYGQLTARTVRHAALMLVLYAGLIGITVWRFVATPTGFIPEQDQGALIGVISLPPGASSERTNEIMQQAMAIVEDMPGIDEVVAFSGFNAASSSLESNSGALFARLAPFEQREREGVTAVDLSMQLTQRLAAIQGASIIVIPPPTVQGMGNGGGWRLMIQDTSGANYRRLEEAANSLVAAAAQVPEVVGVFSQFSTGAPRLFAELDRDKAQALGVHPADVYSTMNIYLGSLYVNDLNLFGRTYQVVAQAEPRFRDDRADILNLRVRSASGAMVPLASVIDVREDSGATRVIRHNLFPSADIRGQAAPGYSSDQALDAMERLARELLPSDMKFEWTDIAFQERLAGDTGIIVFGLAVVFVFLVLAAQYEAFTLPLSVILIVPMCLLAAIVGVNLRGMDVNILTQIGLVVLIALAAKNAILIVEFARQYEERDGMSRFDAAIAAARTRLRPILMTSFAFILGVLPLAIAEGPGKEMRQALGTAVFFGMLGVTLFGLIFTPVFYVVCRKLGIGRREGRA